MRQVSGDLSEKIDQSEGRQKELQFFQLRNEELSKKMEKFEFLVREKESFLLMYKNSQMKVSELDRELQEHKHQLKKLKNKFELAVSCIFESNNQGLINELDQILGQSE